MSEIVERFERVRRNRPDRPLIHLPSSHTSLTADDLRDAAAVHRRALERLGLEPGQLLLSALGNRPSALPLWLACRSLDLAVMPVDSGTTLSEIGGAARRFGAAYVLLPASTEGGSSLGAPQSFVQDILAVPIQAPQSDPQTYPGAATLKLTSGSTGLPKATFTTESQLILDTEHITTAMEIHAEDCQIAAIPLSHAYGLGNLVIPVLILGTPIVLRDGFVPHQLPSDARHHNATVFHGVPYMFDHFCGALPPGAWPPTLATLVSAGARLEASTVAAFHAAFGVKIHSFYGTSETGGIAYDDSGEIDPQPTVGRALPGVTITLRPEREEEGDDDGGEEDAERSEGRVHVASEAVSSGYAGEKSGEEGFVDGGFLTGDLGHFDARDRLVLTGRASSFVNVAGRKVQPEEVEQVLRSIPGVSDARVIGASDPIRGQQIVACVVAHERETGVVAIRQYCASRLAPHKIPRTIVWLDRIPLNERGKTDRARLDAIVREHLARAAGTRVL